MPVADPSTTGTRLCAAACGVVVAKVCFQFGKTIIQVTMGGGVVVHGACSGEVLGYS